MTVSAMYILKNSVMENSTFRMMEIMAFNDERAVSEPLGKFIKEGGNN